MIIYFADRQLNILGQAATTLPDGVIVTNDLKTEDVETGVSIFECDILFTPKTRAKVEAWAEVGNYILRSSDGENEFYSIIDAEIDTKKQRVTIYAEDDGLDLLNEVVGAYEADQPYPISHYVNMYANGAGWEIGINEVEGLTRALSFDSEQTACARLLSIAEAFDNCEISYSFEISGLQVAKKLINLYAERGKDTGVQLRLNKEIDSIITTKTVSNLATALQATGSTPDNAEEPITLLGYEYDDGDFYVDGSVLKSRNAFDKWRRLIIGKQEGGHIVKPFSYDTISQAVLCEKAIAELKTICDAEINYEVELSKLPDNVKIGDRVSIVDDAGGLYLSSRILILETSVCDNARRAVIGENLIRKDGIAEKVAALAAQFAQSTKSVARATVIATNAKEIAETAKTQADTALTESENAQNVATEAKTAADTATQSANTAQTEAQAAQQAVDKVEESVASLQTTVENAQTAANNAQQAATTAETKAEEAKTAAENAQKEAAEAKNKANSAQTAAENAISMADTATNTAETAKTTAETASATATAAKNDAAQAQADVNTWANNLETYKTTVTETYARKTELTETESTLQAQITANAKELNIVHTQVTSVDETANNAAAQAQAAFYTAEQAQQEADKATAQAETAQEQADIAQAAADSSQAEADTAKQAATEAQSVADKAQADLEAAQADLETISARADATEEEIAAAELAVQNAQATADKAQADAEAAIAEAENAQEIANTAVANAESAQNAANYAVKQAEIAQMALEKVNESAASQAIQAAQAAQNTASEAQDTANTAKANADNAQATADQAATAATTAQQAADDAEAKAQQAQQDLTTAQQNLADVTSRVGATEEEVAAAQNAVETAQAAADKAKADAVTAQATADKAKEDAANAQTAADNAKTAADNAQAAADEAQEAANKAQQDVNSLAVRVTTAETQITKTNEQIGLLATKEEVTQTLGGYYTKAETNAAINVKSDEINSSVKSQIEEIEIGGRNLAIYTSSEWVQTEVYQWSGGLGYYINGSDRTGKLVSFEEIGVKVGDDFTIGIDLNAINKPIKLKVDLYRGSTLGENYESYGTETVDAGTSKRVVYTRRVTAEFPYFAIYIGSGDTTDTTVTTEQYKCLKIEKGNKATDWTPAPEDVSADIDTATANASDALIRLEAAETQIKQLADNISMLVQKGDKSSQMVFDESSATWSFDTSEIDGNIKTHTGDIEDLKSKTSTTSGDVANLQNKLDVWEEHIAITTYEDEPCLKLFESDSNYKQYVTNTRRIVTETVNGEEIVKSKVDIDSAQYNKVIASEASQIGGFAWKKYGTNRLYLVWEGSVE